MTCPESLYESAAQEARKDQTVLYDHNSAGLDGTSDNAHIPSVIGTII